MTDSAIQLRPNRVRPRTLKPRQKAEFRITMQNNGKTIWTRTDQYDLRPARNSDDSLWEDGRSQLPREIEVKPPRSRFAGESHTFAIKIEAPRREGTYYFQAQMARRRNRFGRVTQRYRIQVRA